MIISLHCPDSGVICYSDTMIQYLASPSSQDSITLQRSRKAGLWIRCEKPTDEEIDQLVTLGLDADLITDALDPHEVPRVEQDDAVVYFITRVPDVGDQFNSFTTPIMFAITRDHVITLSRDSLGRLWQPFIDRTRVATSAQTQLLLLMLDMISQQYYSRVSAINRETRAVTADVGRLSSKDIATLVEYERKLNDYLDALIPANTATEKLLGGRFLKLTEDDRDLIEDLSVDLEQVIVRCKSLLRTITNVRDSYRAVMDSRLNETIRLLTVITLALTIPTMMAGLFGMNVAIPGNPDSPFAFWTIAGSSVFISLGLVYYFLKKRL
jgi:magnesium transporter